MYLKKKNNTKIRIKIWEDNRSKYDSSKFYKGYNLT